MPISIQQSPKGPVYILECGCCGKDIRVTTSWSLRKAIKQWKGMMGCYNGKWEFICELCRDEATTKVHVGGWRW